MYETQIPDTETQAVPTKTRPLIARCYKYFCHPPTEAADAVRQQIELARDYYRASLDRCKSRRDQFRQRVEEIGDHVVRPLQEQLDQLVLEVVDLRKQKKQARAEARSRKVDTAEILAQIKAKEAEIDELRARLKEVRQARKTDPRWGEASTWNREQEKRDGIELRTEFGPRGRGLHFRNYLAVDAAVKTQLKKRLRDGSDFFYGCVGRWSTLVAGIGTSERIPVQQFMERGHSQIRLDPLPEGFWQRNHRQRRAVLRMQVGTKAAPAWAAFPILLDRPMPQDGLITEIRLIRDRGKRPGTHSWSAVFVVLEPVPEQRLYSREPVGIDVGWRLRKGGVRVAAVHVEGHDVELVLPDRIVSHFQHADGLRALVDDKHNEIRARLAQYWAEQAPPDWLREATANIALWRSTRHLAQVVHRWEHERYDGDEAAFAAASAWAETNGHLLEYAAGARRRATAQRNDTYRKWAARIAGLRRPIVIEDIDLGQISRRVEDGPEMPEAVRRIRHQVAPGLLLQAIQNAARHRGVPVLKEQAMGTSRISPCCDAELIIGDRTDLFRACSSCGAVWDQDYAAARILVRMGRERLRPETDPDGTGACRAPEGELVAA